MSRASRAMVLVVCLLAGLVATASPAFAATIAVDAGAADGAVDGDCSLREAVTAANDNVANDDCTAGTAGLDTISLPADPAIETTSQIDITEHLVIQGVSSAATVIDLSGAGDDGFQVDPGIEVTFRQLAVAGNGNPHEAIDNRGDLTLDAVHFSGNDNPNEGGAVSSIGSLTITDSTFENNHSDNDRGGAVFQEGGSLTITDSIFDSNTADLSGGAVFALEADVEITGATVFTDNEALGSDPFDGGGAVYLDGGFGGPTALIEGTEFSSNASDAVGGGLYMIGVDLTIRDAEFTANETLGEGGGLYADCSCSGGSLIVEDSLFDGNEADFGGGGAYVLGEASFTGATFLDNSSAGAGGGLVAEGSGGPFSEIVSVQESVFLGNTASVGGGLVAGFIQLEVFDTTLHQNHATASGGGDEGGGAIAAFLSLVLLERTTVSDNDAIEVGGGVQAIDALIAIANSTVSGNSVTDVTGEGGGLHLSGTLTQLVHATVTDNSAPVGAGGLWTDEPDDTIVAGSIIAGNPVGGDCSDALEDDSTNLDSDASCFPASGVGSITADPMLGALDNNGGPTQTHALPSGSPALNIGDSGPCGALGGVDQRGEPRPSGGACDLGAYELQGASPPPIRTLTVSLEGDGTVTSEDLGIDCGSECSADLPSGTTGVLVAVPADGAVFVEWEGDCAAIDENECTVEMNGNREVTAKFAGVVKQGRCKGMTFGSSTVLKNGTERTAGTPGDDVLIGSGRRDEICGLGGNDRLKGKGLGDVLLGGGGDDRLVGGKGNDRLNGGAGTDKCIPGKGKDKVVNCE